MSAQQAKHSAKRFSIAGLLCLALLSMLVASRVTTEYSRVTSPDGRFYAVAKYRPYLSFIPMSPGRSSDKPGFVTVFTSDGISCGRAAIPMLQNFAELQWRPDAAEIRLIAEWDLSQHTVREIQ